MKKLLFYAFGLLVLVSSCKKDDSDDDSTTTTEPTSDAITTLSGTNWLRTEDNAVSEFEADSMYIVRDGATYVHTYSYQDYKITYKWVATEVNGSRVPPSFNNPVRIAKVKLLGDKLYFWDNFEKEPWGSTSTYLLGVKQN